MNSHWSFSASPAVAAAAVAGWIACLWLAALQWRRRGRGGRLAAIEGTRVLAVSLVCVALFKPEVVQETPAYRAAQGGGPAGCLRKHGNPGRKDAGGAVQTRAEWLAEMRRRRGGSRWLTRVNSQSKISARRPSDTARRMAPT